MKSTFKYLVTLIMLLIVSGTSIYANNSAVLPLDALSFKSGTENTANWLLSQNKHSFFIQNFLFNKQILTDCLLLEIEEEEQAIEKINNIQGNSSVKSIESNFNQYFLKVPVHLKPKSCDYYFSFFKSKKATSLYLLFEVFRI